MGSDELPKQDDYAQSKQPPLIQRPSSRMVSTGKITEESKEQRQSVGDGNKSQDEIEQKEDSKCCSLQDEPSECVSIDMDDCKREASASDCNFLCREFQ
jgi:hypothetical protein